MAVTQLGVIKATSFILQNVMALFTVLPLAILVIGLTKAISGLLRSRTLVWIGAISYEVYLVHAFTLEIIQGKLIKSDLVSIVMFLIATGAGANILYLALKKGFIDGRFNSYYPNKERREELAEMCRVIPRYCEALCNC